MTFHRTRIRWGRVAVLVLAPALCLAALGRTSSPRTIVNALPTAQNLEPPPTPAPGGLDPALRKALRRAMAAAAADGVAITIDSGRRTPEYQQQLLDEAIAKYGSREEAARWVATPETSAHVSGDAVDVGPTDAMSWLSIHGARYGLCQIYANELWHYELRPEAVRDGCPPMYADPTQDPRMQR